MSKHSQVMEEKTTDATRRQLLIFVLCLRLTRQRFLHDNGLTWALVWHPYASIVYARIPHK